MILHIQFAKCDNGNRVEKSRLQLLYPNLNCNAAIAV